MKRQQQFTHITGLLTMKHKGHCELMCLGQVSGQQWRHIL